MKFLQSKYDVKDDLDHIVNAKIIFNFVNVKLVLDPALKLMHGNKDSAYQTTVRFNKTTTFDEIRKFVCTFWVLSYYIYFFLDRFLSILYDFDYHRIENL